VRDEVAGVRVGWVAQCDDRFTDLWTVLGHRQIRQRVLGWADTQQAVVHSVFGDTVSQEVAQFRGGWPDQLA
jgi:hypothetical protein